MKRNAINTLYNIIRIQMFTVCTTPPPEKKLGVVQRLNPAKSNIYARPRAGLFFCLASTRCRAFLFARRRMSHTQAFTAALLPQMNLYSPNVKTVHRALQGHYRLFAAFCGCCTAVQFAMLYSLQGAGGHTST